MSFGEIILKKYGWSKGKGLGRKENGISTFIKPKLKSNLSGVGHSEADEHTFHWWDHLYNKAANNMSIKKNETGTLEIVRAEEIKVSSKKSSLKKNKDISPYGNFVKSCVLEGNTIIENANSFTSKEEEKSLELFKNYTDDELFKKFGGLTGHKGARHGITMSAKLARLEEQEKIFLAKSNNCTEPESSKKQTSNNETTESYNEVSDVNNVEENPSKKKKKKKKHDKICLENVPDVSEQYISSSSDLSSNEIVNKKKRKSNFETGISYVDSHNNEVSDFSNDEDVEEIPTKKKKKKKKYNEKVNSKCVPIEDISLCEDSCGDCNQYNGPENKKKRKNSPKSIVCPVNGYHNEVSDYKVEDKVPKKKKKMKGNHDEKNICSDVLVVNGKNNFSSSDCENTRTKLKHKKKKRDIE